jgi:hypothetical protein
LLGRDNLSHFYEILVLSHDQPPHESVQAGWANAASEHPKLTEQTRTPNLRRRFYIGLQVWQNRFGNRLKLERDWKRPFFFNTANILS